MIMVLYNPRSSNLHYKDKDTLDFAGFPIADQASQRIAMMQNDIVNPSVMQNDAADQDIALGVTCDGEVKDIDHDQCQYGRPELFLIRPLETEDYGTLDDSLVALTEGIIFLKTCMTGQTGYGCFLRRSRPCWKSVVVQVLR